MISRKHFHVFIALSWRDRADGELEHRRVMGLRSLHLLYCDWILSRNHPSYAKSDSVHYDKQHRSWNQEEADLLCGLEPPDVCVLLLDYPRLHLKYLLALFRDKV